jgi:putative hydrolase of the HAD superfamily
VARARALLVDYGGVLTTPVRDSFAAFARREGLEPDAVWRAMRDAGRGQDDPFSLVETGRIDEAQFDRRLAAILSERLAVPIAADGLRARLFSAIEPDRAMVAAVRAARARGVPVGLVSNSWGGTYGEGGSARADFDRMFDAVVISGEVGLRKPEPGIYRLAASRIGVPPQDCVFVDDVRVNVEGAAAVGMIGVLHRTAAETIPELEELLGVPLRDAR